MSLALFGAYVTRAGITLKDSSILDPEVGGGFVDGSPIIDWELRVCATCTGKGHPVV